MDGLMKAKYLKVVPPKRVKEDMAKSDRFVFFNALKTVTLYECLDTISSIIAWRDNHAQHGDIHSVEFELSGSKYNVHPKRLKAIQILGGRCSMCYEHDLRCLEIDHIDGEGGQERKKKSRTTILNKIIRTGGDGYQLLCANCHRKKTHANGEFGESPSNTGLPDGDREEKVEVGSGVTGVADFDQLLSLTNMEGT